MMHRADEECPGLQASVRMYAYEIDMRERVYVRKREGENW